jgi:general nucleoside transport system permease protein
MIAVSSITARANEVLKPLRIPFLATVAAFGLGLVLIVIAGAPLGDALSALKDGMYGTPYALGASLNSAALLALVGGGFVVAARCGLTNVGGEGQINMGALAATAIGLHGAARLPGPLPVFVPLIAAILAGAAWGAIAGALKAWRGTNEVISTLLMNFVAIGLVSMAVHEQGLLRQPATSAQTLPNSSPLPEVTHLALLPLGGGAQGTIGIVIAALVLIAVAVLVRRSAFGLKLRSVALGKQAAARAGISPGSMEIAALAIAGGASGLAGGILMLSTPFILRDGFSSGYGFQGLVVGLLARGSAPGVALAALLFGFLDTGGISLEVGVGVPSTVILIVEAVIVITIAASAGLGVGRLKIRRALS